MHDASLVLFPSPLIPDIVASAESLDTAVGAIETGFAALGTEVDDLHRSATELARTRTCFTSSTPVSPAETAHLFTRELEALVGYVQTGDALRQRGEHIVIALHEISAWLASADTRLDFGLRATEVDCLLTIQITQLTAIGTDATAVHQRMLAAFTGIEAAAIEVAIQLGATPPPSVGAAHGHGNFLCTQLQSIATRAAGRLVFLQELARALTVELDALARIRRDLAPHVDASIDTTAISARFGRHYTTDAERAAVAPPRPGAPSGPASPNIEIF